MNAKKITFTMVAAITALSFASCGDKNESDSKKDSSSSYLNVQKVNSEDVQDFILIDDNGNPYIRNEDGSIEYINEDINDGSDEIVKIKDEYTGMNLTASIDENWYGTESAESVYFYPEGTVGGNNYYSITSFSIAGLNSFEDWTAESITNDFDEAVKNGAYKSAEFKESYTTTVDDSQAMVYITKITTNDDLVIDLTSYVINDDFGGHVVILSDLEDDTDCQSPFETFINTVKFG